VVWRETNYLTAAGTKAFISFEKDNFLQIATYNKGKQGWFIIFCGS